MTEDPYFDGIASRLVRVPASSRAALEKALGGVRPPAPAAGQADAVARAQNWVRRLVRAEFAPAAGTPFLPFPKEDGEVDVVRARWRTKDLVVETAQSAQVFALRIEGGRPADDDPGPAMARLASEVLVTTGALRFETFGETAGIVFGGRVFAGADKFDPLFPSWEQELRWWCDGKDAGFVTLKSSGIAVKESPSPLLELNRRWFE